MSPQLEKILVEIKPFQVEATKKEHKIMSVSLLRDIYCAFDDGEISFSKISEIINCLHLKQLKEMNDFIPVSERLPETKDYPDGTSYSDTVWATDGKNIYVMRYASLGHDDYGWCNCYNDVEGDGEFDDDYNIIAWKPINKPSNE